MTYINPKDCKEVQDLDELALNLDNQIESVKEKLSSQKLKTSQYVAKREEANRSFNSGDERDEQVMLSQIEEIERCQKIIDASKIIENKLSHQIISLQNQKPSKQDYKDVLHQYFFEALKPYVTKAEKDRVAYQHSMSILNDTYENAVNAIGNQVLGDYSNLGARHKRLLEVQIDETTMRFNLR